MDVFYIFTETSMPFGEETIHHFERLYSHKLGLTVTVTVMALSVAPTIFKAFLAAPLLPFKLNWPKRHLLGPLPC